MYKKHVIELKELIKNHGYWSQAVYNYNNDMVNRYGKYNADRIETSAILMMQTGVYKLVNP